MQTRLLQMFQSSHSSTILKNDDDDSVREGEGEGMLQSDLGSDPSSRSRSMSRSESVTMVLMRGLGLLDRVPLTASVDYTFPWQQLPLQPQHQPQQPQQQRGCEEDKGYQVDTPGGGGGVDSSSVGIGGGGLMPLCVALHVMVAAELLSEDARHELGR